MEESTGWSVLLGVVIGAGYALLAYVTHRIALALGPQRFLAVVLGGMLLRMVILLGVAGAALALLPLQVIPFAAALMAALLVGLVLDLFLLQRTLRVQRDPDAASSGQPE